MENKVIAKEYVEKNDLLRKISKEFYNDEWFIEKSILSYKAQQGKTYTFFKNNSTNDLIHKYNWCQRPDSTNMSLNRFVINGEVQGWMSESLAEEKGLQQIDLNEFMHRFVQRLIKENIGFKKELNIKKCLICGNEFRANRKNQVCCSEECKIKKRNQLALNYIKNATSEQKEKIKQTRKKYYEKNKDKIAEYKRKYKENNRQKILGSQKKWRETHKEHIKTYREEYKKRKNN